MVWEWYGSGCQDALSLSRCTHVHNSPITLLEKSMSPTPWTYTAPMHRYQVCRYLKVLQIWFQEFWHTVYHTVILSIELLMVSICYLHVWPNSPYLLFLTWIKVFQIQHGPAAVGGSGICRREALRPGGCRGGKRQGQGWNSEVNNALKEIAMLWI